VLAHGHALLGHARLAVIDIDGGRQPMTAANGRLAMVYNGEIYNFAALRRELEAAGHAFATRSDSEVLLTGYLHWGESVTEKLDGMFAFAIHDLGDGSVFLARDRLGIKPLFWGEHGGGLVAASTLAPFFALQPLPEKLDAEGLRDYLAFQTPLAPRTLVRDIQALPPGACLRWKPGCGASLRQWWTIPDATEAAPDHENLVCETDRLLARAVKDQLVADVPLGAFLSGGIDSSLVVHYMAQAGASPLKTFSVRFAEAGFDESPAARAVAEKYGTEHHVLDAPQLTADTLAAALADLDQPLADPAYIPTWALSRLTRQHVTVALSGDGGDELFGGYPRFLDTADKHPDSAAKRMLRATAAAWPRPGRPDPPRTGRRRAAALPPRRTRRLPGQPQGPAPLPGARTRRAPAGRRRRWNSGASSRPPWRLRPRRAAARRPVDLPLRELPGQDRPRQHGPRPRSTRAAARQCVAGPHVEAASRACISTQVAARPSCAHWRAAPARRGVESREARLLGAPARQLCRPLARLVRRPGGGG
jgi:asparagine synthase (glutamine-hydrolysing)